MEYHEATSELDAREILRYLNHLGIHNISGEVLKYFITDLKKLIKYDLQNRSKSSDDNEKCEVQGPERLHSASTFCSRIRSKVKDGQVLCVCCTRDFQKSKKFTVRNTRSAPNLGPPKPEEKPLRRACSCVRVEKRTDITIGKEKPSAATSTNLIKVPIQPTKKKCDPVSLYHYYTSLWAKYKPNVPGENDWSDLRWSVRQKMAGVGSKQVITKVPELNLREKSEQGKSLR